MKDNFYGIGMNSIKDAKDFNIVSNSGEEISFNKNNRTMNPDIYAWAKAFSCYSSFAISVTNNTKSPIYTNYFSDDFELIDKNGRVFKLEKEEVTYYPETSYINPGQTVRFPLKNPFFYNDQKLEKETALIICTLGSLSDRVTIVLKPLPEEQNISTTRK
jgi:hypothetical protein